MAEDKGQEERIIPRIEKDDSRLFIGIGTVFTFLWIGFFIVLYSQTELPKEWSLNHLGDFLAGVEGPKVAVEKNESSFISVCYFSNRPSSSASRNDLP